MGKFIIKTRSNGEFQFVLHASNGQAILASEVYTTKAACENGIESVKRNAGNESKYVKKTSANGKFMFNLKSGNGQIIGTSELYETEAARDNGIDSVMRNALESTEEEQLK
jgi:hypothetical protein